MGAVPERRFSGPGTASGFDPLDRKMGTSETPEISLVTTTRKAPAWQRSVFNLDNGFRGLMLLAALCVLAIVGLIVIELLQRSAMAWHAFGLHFFIASAWDPVSAEYGAVPFIYGTLVSSLIALLIAVPLAIAVAVFVTEMCPQPLRKPIGYATELLAAIPSVIYGLWAMFILVPLFRIHIQPWCMADCISSGLTFRQSKGSS